MFGWCWWGCGNISNWCFLREAHRGQLMHYESKISSRRNYQIKCLERIRAWQQVPAAGMNHNQLLWLLVCITSMDRIVTMLALLTFRWNAAAYIFKSKTSCYRYKWTRCITSSLVIYRNTQGHLKYDHSFSHSPVGCVMDALKLHRRIETGLNET